MTRGSGTSRGRPSARPRGGEVPSPSEVSQWWKVKARDAVTGRTVIYDFTTLNVPEHFQRAFARCFTLAVGPQGTMRSASTMDSGFKSLRRFAELVGRSSASRTIELSAAVLAEARLSFDARLFDTLRGLLRRDQAQWNPKFVRALVSKGKKRDDAELQSYSDDEFDRIINAARDTVRAARDRLRASIRLLEAWRLGEFAADPDSTACRRGAVLEQVASEGDFPRRPAGRGRSMGLPNMRILALAGFKSGTEAIHALYLTQEEVLAFGVLLVALTGQNFSTINRLEIGMHVSSVVGGRAPLVGQVETLKPRRGKWRARQTIPIEDLPPWALVGSERSSGGDLRTPFGVFSLLVELGRPAREQAGSTHLFAWFGLGRGRGTQGRGVRPKLSPKATASLWSDQVGLLDDHGLPLGVTYQRIRLTHLQTRDEPVAQTETTLRSTYQIRDRAALLQYQRTVEQVQEKQVAHAKATRQIALLTPDEVAEAQVDVLSVAARLGVRPSVLEQAISGRLTTVVASCTDNENGPYTPGRPCEASFLLCAGCPCAVALPAHWPLIVGTLDLLRARKANVSALTWAERFAGAEATLEDLVRRLPRGATEQARSSLTNDESALIERLLNRELDA